jgi:hypothetical protein
LKPGGRLAVSDIALKRGLPPELGADLMAYVGCIAGAILIEEYRRGLIEAGFAHVVVIDSGADLNAYAKVENQAACCSPPAIALASGPAEAECCSPTSAPASLPIADSGCRPVGPAAVVDEELHARLADLLRRHDVNDYAASVKVFAVQPR